jgi:hypothetical protein
MSFIDLFAAFVLAVIFLTAILVFVALGAWPGIVARRRGHPYARAVAVSGWITLIFGFVFWPLALIWAYVDVPRPPLSSTELDDLRRRIAALEAMRKREVA